MPKTKTVTLTCLRCGGSWNKRSSNKTPRRCFVCRSEHWNVARVELKCLRCDSTWNGRSLSEKPKQCPRCRSPYWDVPRVRGAARVAVKVAKTTKRKVASVTQGEFDDFA